jgi:hypothetical protein
MTGGGILTLVAYGAQNVILSGNPQMTYFYKAFKRYSHFAMENITVPLEGPNELQYDKTIRLRAKIPRYGDLLSDMYFSFRIPDIYSKYLIPQPPPGRVSQWEFQWVRYLGCAIINRATFYVGPNKIQDYDGNYLLNKANLDLDQDQFQKWKWLVGETDELTKPDLGAYAGGTSRTGYPTVITDPTRTSAEQVNRPSIFGRDIHVPLGFWFSEAFSQALPLVALQSQDCEVELTLNPISSLYTVLDASGYRVNPDFFMRAPLAGIQQNLPEYASASYSSSQIRFFFTDVGATVPPLNTWFINPRLQCTYVYLAQDEQRLFASRPLSYLVSQVTSYPFLGVYNRQVFDLETHNPITRLIIVPQRSDAQQRNDVANFTNWYTYPYAPFNPTPDVIASLRQGYSSGLLIPNAQEGIIRGLRVLCEGNEIQEEKSGDFLSRLVPYRYAKGVGEKGLLLYSFQLGQSPTQPSGSINASRIRNFQVEVDVWPLPTATTYTYNIMIYVENLNWLVVASGTGALRYAL